MRGVAGWAVAGVALAAAAAVVVSTLWTGLRGAHRPAPPAHARPAPGVPSVGAVLGLPPLPAAAQDTPERIELGRKLFFDRRLSFNGTMSCAMCHVPEEGFASNASQRAVGIEGRSLRRNAPTVLNVAWQALLFHDGREPSLAAQAWSPLLHPDEMANPSPGHLIGRLRALPDYAGRFEGAFGGAGASMDTVGEAIAAYERSLVAGNSRFDRWRYGGEAQALSAQEQEGFRVFAGRGGCVACHPIGERDALFSDGSFRATGAGLQPAQPKMVVPLAPGVQTEITPQDLAAFADKTVPDLGRFDVTLDPADRYAFKVPSLRNVTRTAPYMHDGSLPTLEAVVDFYDRGGVPLPDGTRPLPALDLSAAEKAALVVFLHTLEGGSLDALVAQSHAEPRR
jgi:cytochrome c peroxidase